MIQSEFKATAGKSRASKMDWSANEASAATTAVANGSTAAASTRDLVGSTNALDSAHASMSGSLSVARGCCGCTSMAWASCSGRVVNLGATVSQVAGALRIHAGWLLRRVAPRGIGGLRKTGAACCL